MSPLPRLLRSALQAILKNIVCAGLIYCSDVFSKTMFFNCDSIKSTIVYQKGGYCCLSSSAAIKLELNLLHSNVPSRESQPKLQFLS